MAPKIGLQVPLDLSLESLISVAPKVQPAQEQAIAQPQESVQLESLSCDKPKRTRKQKAEKASPRTVYLTDSVFQRLQLMAIVQKKRISGVIADLLDKSAENLMIKKVS